MHNKKLRLWQMQSSAFLRGPEIPDGGGDWEDEFVAREIDERGR
jgi:hypothetical protein